MYIFVDLVKCSVLTLVGEIPHDRSDHYYYFHYCNMYRGRLVVSSKSVSIILRLPVWALG